MGAYSCRVPIHVGCLFSYGCLLSDVVVVIELGAYIHGVLTFNGCLLSRFYGNCYSPTIVTLMLSLPLALCPPVLLAVQVWMPPSPEWRVSRVIALVAPVDVVSNAQGDSQVDVHS